MCTYMHISICTGIREQTGPGNQISSPAAGGGRKNLRNAAKSARKRGPSAKWACGLRR